MPSRTPTSKKATSRTTPAPRRGQGSTQPDAALAKKQKPGQVAARRALGAQRKATQRTQKRRDTRPR
jgi:hypothetical protein